MVHVIEDITKSKIGFCIPVDESIMIQNSMING
jgi:hypothetical protein